LGSAALLVVISPYRMARVTSFLNPWDDPFDKGFQLVQSLIAIGSGAISGAGLGNSVQKLFYLPEAHTDFLFAVIAEEFGLIGVLVVVGLFAALVWRILQLAGRAERVGLYFGAHIAHGAAIWLGLQAFINIGVNMGLLPTKGLTLPLMSYGGSSLLITCVLLALLLRLGHECSVAEAQAVRRHDKPRANSRSTKATATAQELAA
jgi:cell division protein FtsW